jgi:SET domain-containing protein
MLFQSPKVAVGESTISGRGVFAVDNIQAGEVLEECHFFLLENDNFSTIDSVLKEMVFAWPAHTDAHRFAVVLGGGTVYNHSYENNATWETDEAKCCFRFLAVRDIKAGEEIFTNYNRSGGNSFD